MIFTQYYLACLSQASNLVASSCSSTPATWCLMAS
jgi:hypothetical protein